jgi:hypothetical protein
VALPLALILSSGCSVDKDARAARRAADRYLAALAAHDDMALREGGTCAVATSSIRGATVLRSGRIYPLSRRTLDSLTAAALDWERRSEADWSHAVEWDADSLWLRLDAARRMASIYRSASLAAARSAAAVASAARTDSAATLHLCTSRVRIRWGGPLVGPQSVDREHVLRVLTSPGGRWIVFSLEQREDDAASRLGKLPPRRGAIDLHPPWC